MSKQKFIEELSKRRSDFKDNDQAEMMANLLDTVSSDIYSESQRFVFELIQNADDAAAQGVNNEVHFEFLTNCLIASHNGMPFNEPDINSLTSAGTSTKKNDQSKTGYKGIGFKSVFGRSNRVTIFSDGFQFRFDKLFHSTKLPWQIIPIWTELKDLEKNIAKFLTSSDYNVSTAIEINGTDPLQNDLDELLASGQILLFLRKITKISVAQNGIPTFSVEKNIVKQGEVFNEVTLSKNGKKVSTWIVKTFEKISVSEDTKSQLKKDDKTPDKLKDANFTEITFATRIEDGKLKPLTGEDSLIFTYLPTKVLEFKFPFLVNGSFLTNAAREGLHEDRAWNQWLFKLVAEKLIDWLASFKTTKFKYQILHLLPQKFKSHHNELKKAFDEAMEKAIQLKPFVLSKNSLVRKASELIVDETGLSELDFVASEVVITYINDQEKTNYSGDCFIHPDVQRKDKLRALGTKFFDSDSLESFFLSPLFTSNHQLQENFELIKYFYDKALRDKTKEWHEKLKTIPFIYAEGKALKSPKTVCFPSMTFETEFGDGVAVIHDQVYTPIDNNSKVKKWLETLGVKEPSDSAYLENKIIGNIEDCINTENYLKVTRYLFNQHKKGNLLDHHYESLQELRVFTISKEFIPADQCYLSDFYDPLLPLEAVNKAGKYISEAYKQADDLTSEWKTFFLKIGVSESISIVRTKTSIHAANGTIEPSYFREMGENAKSGHRYPHLVSSSNSIVLDRIRFSEFAKEHKFSKLFWKQAIATIDPDEISQYAYMPWGHFGSQQAVENYFFWGIRNSKIFPATTKQCFKASEIYINDKQIVEIADKYLPVFDFVDILPENWKQLLPFKQKLELEDYLTILEKISDKIEEGENSLTKIDLKRIGLIYNKLSALLPDFSEEKKILISEWASVNELISTTENFEPANELKWIKIEGFTSSSESLKVIQIPENCDVNTQEFENLIALFGIQVINTFDPVFDEPSLDESIKYRIEQILPYFSAIAGKKRYVDTEREFGRIYLLMDQATFYSAKQIKLTFKHQEEVIEGPKLYAFREQNEIYFRGRWKNPLTMFALIPEITALLEISGLEDELRLLLELEEEQEIQEWLTNQAIDLETVPSKWEFSKQKKEFKENGTSSKTEEANRGNLDLGEIPRFDTIETFQPEISPNDFDITKISTETKTHSPGSLVVAETVVEYAEISNSEVRDQVGRWCEEFVDKYLRENVSKYSNVLWVNKDGESGKPYDFEVVENGNTKYIDVKGTPSSEKDIAYMSPTEWAFMFENGENYSLYRVYNAGKKSARITVMDNPRNTIEQGGLMPNQIMIRL